MSIEIGDIFFDTHCKNYVKVLKTDTKVRTKDLTFTEEGTKTLKPFNWTIDTFRSNRFLPASKIEKILLGEQCNP